MAKVDQVFDAARALPKRKRAELAQILLASLKPPDLKPGLSDDEWAAEMTRRAEATAHTDWKGVSARTAIARVARDLKLRRK